MDGYFNIFNDQKHQGATRHYQRLSSACLRFAIVLLFAVTALIAVSGCRRKTVDPLPEPEFPERALLWIEQQEQGQLFHTPTDQDRLLDTDCIEVYMPTASGRVESALFGSVRTRNTGNTLRASFHEGIDIAPMRRDIRGRPLDKIYAAADGRVVFINPTGGASNYGIYIVLAHDDTIGEYYTLYAHLASVSDTLRVGRHVKAGDVLGIMGNTANHRMPMARAHLHFEIVMMLNRRFDRWFTDQQLTGINSRHHGWNLRGIDPLTPWLLAQTSGTTPRLCMATHLPSIPPAFKIVFRTTGHLDFYQRHPLLWQGHPMPGNGAIVMNVSESGLPLQGREANAEELEILGSENARVLSVDTEVLGRNGRYLIRNNNGRWVITDEGHRWLSILRY